MSNINIERVLSQIKQKVKDLNLKDKWAEFKLKLDQIPIPKWLLVIITSISVIVAIVSLIPNSPKNSDYSNNDVKINQIDEYGVMLEEYALKVDRLMDLIYDMSDSDNPFAYTKQIETLAAECEKLEKKLNQAPLDSRQKLYKNEIKAELEDAIRRLTWN